MPIRSLLGSAAAMVEDLWRLGRAPLARTLLLVVLGSVLEGVGVLLLIPLLAFIMDGDKAPVGPLHGWLERIFVALDLDTPGARLWALLAGASALMLVRTVVIWRRDSSLASLQFGFISVLRSRIAEKLARAPWEAIARLRHARVIHLFGEDMQRIGGATQQLLTAIIAVVTLAVQAAIALVVAPIPACFALLGLAIGGWSLRRLMRRARDEGGAVMRGNLALIDSTAQFLGGLKLAASQNLQPAFLRTFEEMQDEVSARQIGYARDQSRARLSASLLSFGVGGGALLIGQALAIPGATLIGALLLIARMGGPAARLQQAAQLLAYSLPAYDRIGHLEHDIGAPPAPAGATPATMRFAGDIVYDDVGFAYAEASGLRNVRLRLEPGLQALIGESGTGKTSIADLATGLIVPRSGTIRVGDIVLTPETAAAWRDHVGYAGQDPFLQHASLRDNLRWGCPHADEAAMWQALEVVGAAERVRRFAAGLDTLVGERGGLLSGGERQRIAIARALLREPHLLILDEATSGLDADGERKMFERLKSLPTRPIILLITHRLDNLDLCERIYRLADGGIVASPRMTMADGMSL